MIRIAHFSDLHYGTKKLAEADRCFGAAIDRAIALGAEAAVLSGDATDHGLDLHAPAAERLVAQVRRLADHCPVLMLQGTFSHEPPGTLAIFRLLGGRHPVHVASRIAQVALTAQDEWLASTSWCFDSLPAGARALITCIPTVNKAVVAATVGAAEAAQAVGEHLALLLRGYAPIHRAARRQGVPTIGVSHGTVFGCVSEHGVPMASFDHEFTTGALFGAEALAFMLGHIHRHQAWEQESRAGRQCIAYPGSIGRFHYGEEGGKGFLFWEVDADQARFTREASLVGVDFPEQKPLAPFLAVMKATDRAGIGDALPPCPAFLFPCLMPMDVSEHEGQRLGAEQRAGGELVIEAGHRDAVLAHATEHRAVRHADGRHALPTCRAVDRRVAAQQQGQVLAHGLRGFRRTDRCGHHRLVHRGDAGNQGTSTGRQTIETPTGRSEPFVLGREGDLRDTAGHMNRMPSAQQPEDRQGARWLMRECPLQHQHRAVVSQSPHLRDQPFGGRGMQVQAMVGGIARENRRLRTQRDGPVDGSAEATVGFRQFLGTVVQIGEMRDADHAVLPREASCISLAILSR